MNALPAVTVGRAVRTTNAAESDPERAQVGVQWGHVLADEALLTLAARADARLYAALFDYDSDETGAYTQVVGVAVDAGAAVPPEHASIRITDIPRTAYPAAGDMPAALIAAWGQVWQDTSSGALERAFSCDLEVHDPDGSATILVATRAWRLARAVLTCGGRLRRSVSLAQNGGMRAWMVRGGREGQREHAALQGGRALIGWSEVGDLSGKSREDIRDALTSVYPGESNHLIGNWTGQLDRFVNEMRIGDIVVMPLKTDGLVAIGTIQSDYGFDHAGTGEHFRMVDWTRSDVDRATFKHDLRASLGSLLTVCELTRVAVIDRLQEVQRGGADPGPARDGAPLPGALESLATDSPTTMTIRELLDLVGVERRTAQTVALIDERLRAARLTAVPPITDADIDEQIVVAPIRTHGAKGRLDGGEPVTPENGHSVGYRIHQIPSARRTPVSVAREDLIADARTAMLEGNFSQLAVVDAGGLVGVITWESIAIAHMHGTPVLVGEAMTTSPPTVSQHANVLDVVSQIEQNGYVFVRGEANEIGGIVTVADLTAEFGRDRRPLVMIEEIELRMRRAVKLRLTDADVERSPARCKAIDDLTLGAYPYVFDDDQNWNNLGWVGIARERLRALVKDAADVRNNLMHFSPDPLSEETFAKLEGTLRLLRAVDSTQSRRPALS